MKRAPDLPRWPTLHRERRIGAGVCGIDEAGCAPLAGPVVAAAVILPTGAKPAALRGLNDSKLLSVERRERFFGIIRRIADVGVGTATVAEIDSLNIHQANLLAMRRAVAELDEAPAYALVDGRARPRLDCPVETLIKGDRRSLSIAAASVVAKVTRDRLMHELAVEFPDYGWQTNVGYPTDAHYLGLLRKGPSEHHRTSFAPVNTIFSPMAAAWNRFRFEPVDRIDDPYGIELLVLRSDLHVVFDRARRHIGVLRKRRGGWTFVAVGYGEDREPIDGGGPCARFHGQRVESPDRPGLTALLAG